jgi:aminoglycoside phosphotransferase (APT) family kinase protein
MDYKLHMVLYTFIDADKRLLLINAGKHIYGPTDVEWVQSLPFGLIVKKLIDAPKSEPNTLQMVEKHTTIPAPRVVEVFSNQGATYLVMTRLPGTRFQDVFHLMNYDERNRLADDLKACVTQLRRIPNKTAYLFGDTLGGKVFDHRIPDNKGGPFNSEADFYDHLTSHLKCTIEQAFPDEHLRYDHRSYFTHSDFSLGNLLVEGGRLSGIVDWECAGFLPEYWEFTKAVYSSFDNPGLTAVYSRAFDNNYQDELEFERKLWRYTPFGV